MSIAQLPPVPWRYTDSPLAGSFWTWETPHFVGTISTEQRGFYWWLGDLVRSADGTPVTVTEGRGADFAAAERDLREAVGKSYPARLGYRQYAGPLATTFQLFDGSRVDLGQFEGKRVIVTVAPDPGQPPLQVIGSARVVHYDLEIDNGGGGIHRIRPVRITRILLEGGGSAQTGHVSDTYTGVERIYRGKPELGCTGVAGYLPATVEHHGAACPVHERDGGPGSALSAGRFAR